MLLLRTDNKEVLRVLTVEPLRVWPSTGPCRFRLRVQVSGRGRRPTTLSSDELAWLDAVLSHLRANLCYRSTSLDTPDTFHFASEFGKLLYKLCISVLFHRLLEAAVAQCCIVRDASSNATAVAA